MTIYISIGNSDDKLTQFQWASFQNDVSRALDAFGAHIHGQWYSAPDSAFQNKLFNALRLLHDGQPDEPVIRDYTAYSHARTAHEAETAALTEAAGYFGDGYQLKVVRNTVAPDPAYGSPRVEVTIAAYPCQNDSAGASDHGGQ
jgi:hypothetical protein